MCCQIEHTRLRRRLRTVLRLNEWMKWTECLVVGDRTTKFTNKNRCENHEVVSQSNTLLDWTNLFIDERDPFPNSLVLYIHIRSRTYTVAHSQRRTRFVFILMEAATTATTNKALEGKQFFGVRFIDDEQPSEKLMKIRRKHNSATIYWLFSWFSDAEKLLRKSAIDSLRMVAGARVREIGNLFSKPSQRVHVCNRFEAQPTQIYDNELSSHLVAGFPHTIIIRLSLQVCVCVCECCFENQLILLFFARF